MAPRLEGDFAFQSALYFVFDAIELEQGRFIGMLLYPAFELGNELGRELHRFPIDPQSAVAVPINSFPCSRTAKEVLS